MKNKSDKSKIASTDFFLGAEIKSLKTLIVAYTIVILGAIFIFLSGKIMGPEAMKRSPITMKDWQWIFMIMFNFISSLYAFLVIRFGKRENIFFAKYILFGGMNMMVALLMLWVGSLWVFLGYMLLLTMAGFFYDRKLSLFTGICSFLTFFIIIFSPQPFSTEEWGIWIIYFLAIMVVTVLINDRNLNFLKILLKKQQEIGEEKELLGVRVRARTEELKQLAESLDEQVRQKTKELEAERASLEIKVKERTKKLEELTKGLDEKVKQRTKELQKRIDELERINKLIIGRELKMVELKKEIEALKKGKRKI